ncbi:MAG: glucosamine-6-phosphate deaminase, partial [Clostridia bacterium]|nr:glucosamine-6-phosphate deaminase [Clostridia bacterium]
MKLIVDTVENCASRAADRYCALLRKKPDAVLGLATGGTPETLYSELARRCRAGEVSFAQAATFNLDEYVGLDGTHPQSYRFYMNK